MLCSNCGKKLTNKQTYFIVQSFINHRKKVLEKIKSPVCKKCKGDRNV